MEITFVSDFLLADLKVPGGAEICNTILVSELRSRQHTVLEVRSQQITAAEISASDTMYIISNFVSLAEDCKQVLRTKKYLIFEHDHKYAATRDPSPFKDFILPKDLLRNVSFYENAAAVLAQTKIHAEVMRKNLPSTCNIINLGCSLWTEEQLQKIEAVVSSNRQFDCAVIKSNNPIKNTAKALEFCATRNLKYNLFGDLPYDELMERLAECEGLAFFPTTLETCCRLVVEARMLGCKVYTNELVGATSEEWFKLKGADLIHFVRNARANIVSKVEDLLTVPADSNPGITVILNAYRRTHLLQEQVERVRNQTIAPKQIWIWANYHEDAAGFDYNTLGVDRVFNNDYNWKFYGRFAAALLADTEYVALFDDDTMPGENWLKNCMETMKIQEGILGGIGVKLHSDSYADHERFGWASHNDKIKKVDLVGHAWFFKREWLSHLWTEKPVTWENGEDIQFAYLAQKYGGIGSYVPPHPQGDPSRSSSLKGYELGVDDKATSSAANHHIFYPERDLVVRNAIKNGWKLVKDEECS